MAFLNDSVAPLLKGSYDDGTGRQLYRAVGGLTALAGICAYDADLQGVAQRYFFHSLRMAKASGDRGFGGYVVALLANQALYLGLHRQVIQYAETALRGARQYLTPALVTDLNTLQAKAYARMGDRASCHASMRRSEEMASRIRPSGSLLTLERVRGMPGSSVVTCSGVCDDATPAVSRGAGPLGGVCGAV
ncbi:MAG: hypothetical protein ACRDN1_16965 [Trebonia sp.]